MRRVASTRAVWNLVQGEALAQLAHARHGQEGGRLCVAAWFLVGCIGVAWSQKTGTPIMLSGTNVRYMRYRTQTHGKTAPAKHLWVCGCVSRGVGVGMLHPVCHVQWLSTTAAVMYVTASLPRSPACSDHSNTVRPSDCACQLRRGPGAEVSLYLTTLREPFTNTVLQACLAPPAGRPGGHAGAGPRASPRRLQAAAASPGCPPASAGWSPRPGARRRPQPRRSGRRTRRTRRTGPAPPACRGS